MRQSCDALGREFQRHTLGRQQRLVLLDQRGVRLRKDGLEILHRKRLQFHADRKAPLQLGDQVAGLGQVERARGDEQDVVGLDHAVLGGHRGALDQRQQITLHALARDVGATGLLARGHLVDFVDEDDAVLLGVVQRARLDLVLVDQLRGFFIGQQLERLGDLELARLAPLLPHLAEHAAQLLGHFLHARRAHDFELRARLGEVDLDLLVAKLALAQLFAEHLARRAVGRGLARARRGNQHVEDALLGGVLGTRAHLLHVGLARLLDGDLDQVANDRVHVLADIADLGELGRLDLDERRIGQARQTARNLGLAHAGRANHQDVLRRDLGAQAGINLLAAPAVAQRDRHGALGTGLANDMAVEFGDDLLGGHGGHGKKWVKSASSPYPSSASSYQIQSISTVWCMLV